MNIVAAIRARREKGEHRRKSMGMGAIAYLAHHPRWLWFLLRKGFGWRGWSMEPAGIAIGLLPQGAKGGGSASEFLDGFGIILPLSAAMLAAHYRRRGA